MFSVMLNVVIRLSSNHFPLSSDLISVACTFPFSISLWHSELNSHLLLLVFSYPVIWWGFFNLWDCSFPTLLIPALAFEYCCQKALMKTESYILPANEKLASGISLHSVLMSFFSHYFTVLHIVTVHLSPGDHCWNPGLYLLSAGEWALILRDSNQGEETAGYHPISPTRIGFGGMGPRVWLWFTFPHVCTHSPPHSEDIRLLTVFDKVVVVTLGRLISLAAQVLPVVHLSALFFWRTL